MSGISKTEAVRRLREGELVYRRARTKGNTVITSVLVVPAEAATFGPSLHGGTFNALSPLLAVRLKRVNGAEVPPETVPTLADGDVFEVYYGLKEEN